jgi:predicted nucleic-acid-binding protein
VNEDKIPRRLVAARKAIYTYMKSHGDFTDADINKAHGELAFAQVTLDQLTSANEQTVAIKALANEIKRSNDFTSAVHNVSMGQLARSLADIITTQILGRGFPTAEAQRYRSPAPCAATRYEARTPSAASPALADSPPPRATS